MPIALACTRDAVMMPDSEIACVTSFPGIHSAKRRHIRNGDHA